MARNNRANAHCAPRQSKASIHKVFAQKTLALTPPSPPPLSAATVKRILGEVIENSWLKKTMGEYPRLLKWHTLEDGTTAALIENYNRVRYHWTLCPTTFEPKNLGPVDL